MKLRIIINKLFTAVILSGLITSTCSMVYASSVISNSKATIMISSKQYESHLDGELNNFLKLGVITPYQAADTYNKFCKFTESQEEAILNAYNSGNGVSKSKSDNLATARSINKNQEDTVQELVNRGLSS